MHFCRTTLSACLSASRLVTEESRAQQGYKERIVAASSADFVYTPAFSGVHGNYLKPSVAAAGFDPENLEGIKRTMDFDKTSSEGGKEGPQAWRDIWSAGQGVGAANEILPAAGLVERLAQEYAAARERMRLGQ